MPVYVLHRRILIRIRFLRMTRRLSCIFNEVDDFHVYIYMYIIPNYILTIVEYTNVFLFSSKHFHEIEICNFYLLLLYPFFTEYMIYSRDHHP